MTSTETTALETLHRVFGYDEFRGDQAEIIEQVIGGGDALVLHDVLPHELVPLFQVPHDCVTANRVPWRVAFSTERRDAKYPE